ncbi:uncharacterized protein LOC105435768 [Cucumis sativus]|uniref:Uncharacterized protein n=1 Tax=Cucumis sativus TaxID=3659 RepID=A0A0A0KDC0_CUCSA|nr:uncharacterized protein LOC105435768 [Cucumis sativus]KGN46382.1 hypothetical protein Csa_005722 [Cucumis sativus]
MMNSNTTKTMRLPPRRLMTSPRPNNKRKEREGLDYDDDDDEAHQLPLTAKVPKPTPTPHSKQLLAGYLAHEFLTKGTLFGQTWDNPDPAANANANAMASSSSSFSSFSSSPPLTTEPQEKRQAEAQLHHPKKNYQSYVEVANLLKHNGPHLEGIVNPTQLARFLNL